MQCQACHSNFEIDARDREYYERQEVPEPTLCPDCRKRELFAFRNEINYYPQKCFYCGKDLITTYDPAQERKVLCHHCWWGDKLDPLAYGRDFDFDRPFFEQYADLLRSVPKLCMMNDDTVRSQNCQYTYDFAYGTNCYLVLNSWRCQNCLYGFQLEDCRDCVDYSYAAKGEQIYECVDCHYCYDCAYCTNCQAQCRGVKFGYDLRNCTDCLCCSGLRNKTHYVWNKPCTDAEYKEWERKLALHTRAGVERTWREFNKFIIDTPRLNVLILRSENCTGNNLDKCSNAKQCFNVWNEQNCAYRWFGEGCKDCYDLTGTGRAQLSYDSVTCDHSYGARFTVYCWKCRDLTYSDNCHGSQDLFGCCELKNQTYCIFNKKYAPEEYRKLRQQIIAQMKKTGEWGKFFPPRISPYAYNETAANDWFPLAKGEAVKLGYRWNDTLHATTLSAADATAVPDDIHDVSASLVGSPLRCQSCQGAYRITKEELNFYKKHEIPIPTKCFRCRHLRRNAVLMVGKLYDRHCVKCNTAIKTVYAPKRPEIVYCERCYTERVN